MPALAPAIPQAAPQPHRMSPQGLAMLAFFEGTVLNAYRDAVGVWTVGVGHTSAAGEPKVTPGLKITAEDALQILARDVTQYEAAVLKAVKIAVTQPEFDALVSLTFNIGAGNFAKSDVLAALNAGLAQAAADAFRNHAKARGKTLAGLTTRREHERRLFLTGVYPVPSNSDPASPRLELQEGVTADRVRLMQAALILVGDDPFLVDGAFGPLTEAAVKKFQAQHGLEVDGIVGPATWGRLRGELASALVPYEASAPLPTPAANDDAGGAPLGPDGAIPADPTPWMTIARGYLGLKEIHGSQNAPDILEFWKLCHLGFNDDETPWCAGFVGAMLEKAGIPSTRSGLARSYLKWGVACEAKPGAVVVFPRAGGSGHVGFVSAIQGDQLLVLGGNQSDSVNISKFPKASALGFRWPAAPKPATAAPVVAPVSVPVEAVAVFAAPAAPTLGSALTSAKDALMNIKLPPSGKLVGYASAAGAVAIALGYPQVAAVLTELVTVENVDAAGRLIAAGAGLVSLIAGLLPNKHEAS